MKATRLMAAISVLIGMSACNNSEEFSPANIPAEIKINASVGGMTRLTNSGLETTFDEGDKIMVYGWTGYPSAVPTSPPIASENTLEANDDGSLTWKASPKMLWQNMTDEHHFLGIYPAHEVTDITADSYTLDETKQAASDLLVAATMNVTPSANNVTLEFDHLMAKFVLNLTLNDVGTPTEVRLFCGTEAKVNYLTQTVTADAYNYDSSKFIKLPQPDPNTNTYASIVVPQGGVKRVEVVIGGKLYTYTHSDDIPLVTGQITTLNLSVGKAAVSLTQASVKAWDAESIATIEGGIMTEQVDDYTSSINGEVTTYTVYTAAGLQKVNEILVAKTGYVYDNITLAANIDLPAPVAPATSNWTPIPYYAGTFDGNGKTITGLTIQSTSSNQGLVGDLSGGTIKNLTLTDCSVSGGSNVGAFAAYNKEGTNKNGDRIGGTISGCTLNGTSSISGTGDNIGGIAGKNIVGDGSVGTIIGCTVSGNVTIKGIDLIGGIVGSNSGDVTACLVQGVNIQGNDYLGGVVGYQSYYSLSGCYAYKCTKGEKKEAFDSNANIYGSIEYGSGTHCYYTTDGSTFGNVGGDGANDTWDEIKTAMNTASGGWTWGGDKADSPELKQATTP